MAVGKPDEAEVILSKLDATSPRVQRVQELLKLTKSQGDYDQTAGL